MWHTLPASGQHAASFCSHAAKPVQVTRTAGASLQQGSLLLSRGSHTCSLTATKCDKQGYHEAVSFLSTQQQNAAAAAAAATAATSSQHTPQQPFLASSGMQSTLLHAQQQQVAQLLQQAQAQAHVQTPTRSSCLAVELHQQSCQQVQHTGQLQHISQQERVQLCLGTAAAAVQQRCQQHGQGGKPEQQQQQQQLDMLNLQPVHAVQHQQGSPEPDKSRHLQPPPPLQQQQARPQQQQQAQQAQQQLPKQQRKFNSKQQRQQRQQQQQQRQQQREYLEKQPDQFHRLLSFQHPAQITGWIKHSSSLQELQQMHDVHGSHFNAINAAAMLVKLAKLAEQKLQQPTAPLAAAVYAPRSPGDQQATSSSSSSVTAAQNLALQLAEQLLPLLAECDSARQAANASWALAVLRCPVPVSWLQQAAQQLTADRGKLLASSQPQELGSLAWGLAKLQHDPCCAVWPQIVTCAAQQLARFKPQELAMLLWALASLQQRQQERWRSGAAAAAANKLAQQQQQQQQQQQAQIVRQQLQERRSSNAAASTSAPAAAAAGFKASKGDTGTSSSRSFKPGSSSSISSSSGGAGSSRQQVSALQQQLQAFLPDVRDVLLQQLGQGSLQYQAKELSMLLWSLAWLNFRDVSLLMRLADQLQLQLREGRCNSQDVSNSLWALGKLQVEHQQLVAAAADTAGSWLPQCSNQELSLVLYGAAAATAWRLPPVMRRADSGSSSSSCSVHSHCAAQLWQAGVEEVQQRLSGGAAVGPGECATLLQAAALVLQPASRVRSRQRQQQQRSSSNSNSNASIMQTQQRQQQQQQQQVSGQGQQQQQGIAAGAAASSSCSASMSTSSMSSMSSMWDADDSSCNVTAAAHALMAAVDAHITSQLVLFGPDSLLAPQAAVRYVPCMLASFAAAAGSRGPSPALRSVLLAAAQAAAPAMNRQQLCMTAWAAAKLSAREADEQTAQLMEVLEAVAISKLSSMQPQQLSQLAWAHARLWNLGDGLLMHEVGRAAVRILPRFGPQALSNLTLAFARARHYDGSLTSALARRARVLLPQFSPAELSNLAWGLVTLRYRQLGLLAGIASHTAEHCSSWDVKALVKCASTFASDGMPVYRFRGMYSAVGDALADKSAALCKLTPHELCQLAVAFALARVRHKALAGHIAAVAVQKLARMCMDDVVQLVWALACLNTRHDGLLAAASARVAAEMGASAVGQQLEQAAAESASTGSSSADFADPGSGGSSDGSLFGGTLRPQHLPRLAWAYRTLQHEDACWYLAAARHAASMQQQGPDSGGSSSSTCGGHDNNSGSSSGSSSLGRSSAVAVQSASGQLPRRSHNRAISSQHVNGSSNNSSSRSGGTSAAASSGRKVSCSSPAPALLQRPLHQPQPVMEPATSGVVHSQEQQG